MSTGAGDDMSYIVRDGFAVATSSKRNINRWWCGLLALAGGALAILPISAFASPQPPDASPGSTAPAAPLGTEFGTSVEVTTRGVVIIEPPMVGLALPDDDVFDAEFAPATGGSTTIAGAPSLSGAFSLASRPGAAFTIFLDFDGHTTTDTAWNGLRIWGSSSYRIPESFTSAPYSRDGDAAFNSDELGAIENIWRMVAEDYAPFDVNVTTQDPGVEALRRTSSSDPSYGVRIVVSPTIDWLGGGTSGGVAFVGSFMSSADTPAFVFSGSLNNGFWKFVGEAASHEAGHTLGLYHDGRLVDNQFEEYYRGHGTGVNGWAPIMGVGYHNPTTQWSRGEYANASNDLSNNVLQDDVAIITSRLGPAPEGSGPVAVAPNSRTTSSINAAGATREFTVTMDAGSASISVTPVFQGNLLARMEILRGNQRIALVSPSQAAQWHLTYSGQLAAGTYRIRVTSIGWGTADTGFTTYGSVGQFTLDVGGPGLVPARRLILNR